MEGAVVLPECPPYMASDEGIVVVLAAYKSNSLIKPRTPRNAGVASSKKYSVETSGYCCEAIGGAFS